MPVTIRNVKVIREGLKTQTKEDAYLRVLDLRSGSLADFPSVVYLETLRDQLNRFLETVNEELIRAYSNEKRNKNW